jgi:hypothetical protein
MYDMRLLQKSIKIIAEVTQIHVWAMTDSPHPNNPKRIILKGKIPAVLLELADRCKS